MAIPPAPVCRGCKGKCRVASVGDTQCEVCGEPYRLGNLVWGPRYPIELQTRAIKAVRSCYIELLQEADEFYYRRTALAQPLDTESKGSPAPAPAPVPPSGSGEVREEPKEESVAPREEKKEVEPVKETAKAPTTEDQRKSESQPSKVPEEPPLASGHKRSEKEPKEKERSRHKSPKEKKDKKSKEAKPEKTTRRESSPKEPPKRAKVKSSSSRVKEEEEKHRGGRFRQSFGA